MREIRRFQLKSLADLLARLKELNGELSPLMTRTDVPEAEKAAHLKAISDKLAEIEATEARAALPANQSVERTVPATVDKKLTSAEKVGLIMMGMVTALSEEGTRGFKPVMRVLEERGYGVIAAEFEPAQKRTLNSGNASAGGILLPETMSQTSSISSVPM